MSIHSRVDWEENLIKTHSENPTTTTATSLNSTNNAFITNSTASAMVVEEREKFLIVYACIMVLGTFCYLSRSFSFYRMSFRISINLHDMLFRGVTRAKMIFFNNNQSGRILNRFARDINSIDSLLPNMMVDVFDVSGRCFFGRNTDKFAIFRSFSVPIAVFGDHCDQCGSESMAVNSIYRNDFCILLITHRLYECRTQSQTDRSDK